MPTAAFGNISRGSSQTQSMTSETISMLPKLYDMANNHFPPRRGSFLHARTT